jgi:hypothetical protein
MIISVVITTQKARILLARQFGDISRLRVEGLIGALHKLMPSKLDPSSATHTTLETDAVRYLYRPLNELWISLITTKRSNVVSDIATLEFLSKLVVAAAECKHVSEVDSSLITSKAFEIIFALDEAISLGHVERVNLQEVNNILAMHSQAEIDTDNKTKAKEKQARLVALKRSHEIVEAQRAAIVAASPHTLAGVANRVINIVAPTTMLVIQNNAPSPEAPKVTALPASLATPKVTKEPAKPPSSPPVVSASSSAGGMKLSNKKQKADDAISQVLRDEGIKVTTIPRGSTTVMKEEQLAPYIVTMTEKISAEINSAGDVRTFEVTGYLSLRCIDPSGGGAPVMQIKPTRGVAFKCAPLVDRAEFTKDLTIRVDEARARDFENEVKLVTWRVSGVSPPLKVFTWPEKDNVIVELQYEGPRQELTLDNVMVIIPTGDAGRPNVTAASAGKFKNNTSEGTLSWRVDDVGADMSGGALTLTKSDIDVNALYPMKVRCRTLQLYSGINLSILEGAAEIVTGTFEENYKIVL